MIIPESIVILANLFVIIKENVLNCIGNKIYYFLRLVSFVVEFSVKANITRSHPVKVLKSDHLNNEIYTSDISAMPFYCCPFVVACCFSLRHIVAYYFRGVSISKLPRYLSEQLTEKCSYFLLVLHVRGAAA